MDSVVSAIMNEFAHVLRRTNDDRSLIIILSADIERLNIANQEKSDLCMKLLKTKSFMDNQIFLLFLF
jgi:hypothetical protein